MEDSLSNDAMTDKIWDTITNSAKRRFDYATLEEELPINPDNFLFTIIMGLALGEAKNTIASKLVTQMTMIGYFVDHKEIVTMIAENEKAFGLEVLATRMANDMLDNGGNPFNVYVTITQFLN